MQKLTPKKNTASGFWNTTQFQVSENFQNQNNLWFHFYFYLFFEIQRTSGFHERAGKELVVKARFFNLIILLLLRPLSKWQDQLYDYWVSLVKVRTNSLIFVTIADPYMLPSPTRSSKKREPPNTSILW
jgi:hypothetical protein